MISIIYILARSYYLRCVCYVYICNYAFLYKICAKISYPHAYAKRWEKICVL
jgi:hypothetical protein